MAGPYWRERALTIAEAAEVALMSRATLDVWQYRFGPDILSERRNGRRWLSPCDVTVLRAANSLKANTPLRQAIPTAIQHLLHLPPPGVFLVVDQGKAFVSDANTAARFSIERGAAAIPIGALAAEVEDACAALYQRAPDQQNPKRISA